MFLYVNRYFFPMMVTELVENLKVCLNKCFYVIKNFTL
jgi:hypothetical protein